MKKILTVFGTRREAIKMAPVVLALQKTEGIESIESDPIDFLLILLLILGKNSQRRRKRINRQGSLRANVKSAQPLWGW